MGLEGAVAGTAGGLQGWGLSGMRGGLLGYLANRGWQRGLLGFMFSLPFSSWGFTVFYENEKHEKQQW